MATVVLRSGLTWALAAALGAGAGCGPGLASSGSEGSETGESFPDLPDEEELGCLERGGSFELVGEPTIILEGIVGYLDPTDIEATSEGVLAFWRVGFNGTDPMPNTFARAFDPSVEPIADTVTLMERPATAGPRAQVVGDAVVLSLCGRWGAEDRASSMRVDALGTALAPEHRREPDDRHCGISGHIPDVAWTGSRLLFAWRDNSTGPLPGFELLVDTAGADAAPSTGWVQLQDDGDWEPQPRWVVGTEAAFLVSASLSDGVVLHRFDADGTWKPDLSVELELPAGVEPGNVVMGANADGFVLWMSEGGLSVRNFRWLLDPVGETLQGPIEVELDASPAYDNAEMVARPGGFVIAARNDDPQETETETEALVDVLFLGPQGEVQEIIQLPAPPGAAHGQPSLAQRGDSTYVLYSVGAVLEPEARSLAIARLDCTL